jgi:hypothetical protein
MEGGEETGRARDGCQDLALLRRNPPFSEHHGVVEVGENKKNSDKRE